MGNREERLFGVAVLECVEQYQRFQAVIVVRRGPTGDGFCRSTLAGRYHDQEFHDAVIDSVCLLISHSAVEWNLALRFAPETRQTRKASGLSTNLGLPLWTM